MPHFKIMWLNSASIYYHRTFLLPSVLAAELNIDYQRFVVSLTFQWFYKFYSISSYLLWDFKYKSTFSKFSKINITIIIQRKFILTKYGTNIVTQLNIKYLFLYMYFMASCIYLLINTKADIWKDLIYLVRSYFRSIVNADKTYTSTFFNKKDVTSVPNDHT